METLLQGIVAALTLSASNFPGIEAAGAAYVCPDGSVFTTDPVPGEKARAEVRIYRKVRGCLLAATYHTHPAGSIEFSRQDIAMACQLQVPFYILPAGGQPRVFDCRGLHKNVAAHASEDPRLARGKVVSL